MDRHRNSVFLVELAVHPAFAEEPAAKTTDHVTDHVTAQLTAQLTAQVTECCREPNSDREIMGILWDDALEDISKQLFGATTAIRSDRADHSG